MSNAVKFWDRHAPSYEKSKIANEDVYLEKLKRAQTHFTSDMKLFEIGCGTGSIAIKHAPFVKHIHATDLSSKMLEIADGKAKAAGIENITFEQGDIEGLSLSPESYDVVIANSVLHLLEDRKGVMRKVQDILKPGGLFITSNICLKEAALWIRLIAPLASAVGLLPKFDVISNEECCQEMEDVGFVIEDRWQPATVRQGFFVVARKP